MPLTKSASPAAFKSNLKAEMAAKKPRNQALAIAYRIQNGAKKRADGGRATYDDTEGDKAFRQRAAESISRYNSTAPMAVGTDNAFVVPDKNTYMPDDIVRGTASERAPQHLASGGTPGSVPFYVRSEAHGLEHAGMIHSPIAGRTDRIPISVRSGSFIMPADVVSGLGQGNSMAGASALNKLFKLGPYGSAGGSAPKAMSPKMAAMPRPQKMFADGGDVPGGTPPVDIIAAGGEFSVPPESVAQIGGGDISHGHDILDAFVKHVRKKTIKTLRKLPGPRKN